jgi:hypothetical protein
VRFPMTGEIVRPSARAVAHAQMQIMRVRQASSQRWLHASNPDPGALFGGRSAPTWWVTVHLLVAWRPIDDVPQCEDRFKQLASVRSRTKFLIVEFG